MSQTQQTDLFKLLNPLTKSSLSPSQDTYKPAVMLTNNIVEDIKWYNICFELSFHYPSLNWNLILGNRKLIISGIVSDKLQSFPFLPRISSRFCGCECWGGLRGPLYGWMWCIIFWLASSVGVNFSNQYLSLGLYQGGKNILNDFLSVTVAVLLNRALRLLWACLFCTM